MSQNTKKLVMAAMFMAVGLILPFITMQIPEIGKMLCPMHIPIMLCGIFCGWKYGLIVGFITPLVRGVLFGMPVLIPNGLSMAFELAAYGAVIAILYMILPKEIWGTYISLIVAMLVGRAVYGVAKYLIVLSGLSANAFTFDIFLADAFLNSIPGIIIQLVLIPPIVALIKKNTRKEGII